MRTYVDALLSGANLTVNPRTVPCAFWAGNIRARYTRTGTTRKSSSASSRRSTGKDPVETQKNAGKRRFVFPLHFLCPVQG